MDLREEERGTLLARARDEATAIVRSLPPGTLLGVVRVGGMAEKLTSDLIPDVDVVVERIESVTQTLSGTDLSGAIRHARRMLAGAGGEVC